MLNDAEFALIAREVKTRSGAVLTRDMAGAIEIRLHAAGAPRRLRLSVHELIGAARIRADGALWNAIADNLAQSDTRFFRDRVAVRAAAHRTPAERAGAARRMSGCGFGRPAARRGKRPTRSR